MADNDPFEVFRKQRERDILEHKRQQQARDQEHRARVKAIISGHSKILQILRTLNPEPIILELYEAGFRNRPGYDHVEVTRAIDRVMLNTDGEELQDDMWDYPNRNRKSIIAGCQVEHAVGVLHEISRLTRENAERDSRKWTRHREKVPIYLTGIYWQIVLGSTLDDIAYDTTVSRPFGPYVAIDSDGFTIDGDIMAPTTQPQSVARYLAEVTLRYLDESH